MFPRLHALFIHSAGLALMILAIVALVHLATPEDIASINPARQSAGVGMLEAPPALPSAPATTTAALSKAAATTTKSTLKATSTPLKKASSPVTAPEPGQISRIPDPYAYSPLSFDTVNIATRAALVNILCVPRSGSLRPISGSGVIIDPRGVVLTNAHVAQYVLLAQDPRVDLSCTVRTGTPAVARYVPEVLYIPPAWVEAHAKDIVVDHPLGTGEHDYALLHITGSIDGSPLPVFSSLPVDTRPGIGFPGDHILAASYPAEFVGGLLAQNNLYPASSLTAVKQLLTFGQGSPDLIGLGGIIEAQGGSSGGAVVNAWNRLIGIIVTTSEGSTTQERDLRALALGYINADLRAQTTQDLASLLAGDPALEAATFNSDMSQKLVDLYIPYLAR